MLEKQWKEILNKEKNIVKGSIFSGIISISAALWVSTWLDSYWSLYYWGAILVFMYTEITLLRRKVFLLRIKEALIKMVYKRDTKKDIKESFSSEEKGYLKAITKKEFQGEE